MAMVPEIIKTPKTYWVTRRVDGHSDWTLAFWRELFQNEVDAGAKRIEITVEEVEARGSFGRPPNLDKVVRVTFSGDGHGMDERVIREVFLKPGETTKKDGEFQGGFGTARIMLCFSQVRYSVRTHEWIVEGDGSEYTCQTVEQAKQSVRKNLQAAEASGNHEYAGRLSQELARLEAEVPYQKGCRFEIDVDPNEFPQSWKNGSKANLLDRLSNYISMSQLPCQVTVNGVEVTNKSIRGPSRRRLSAISESGEEQGFATVHTSRGERARYRRMLVVRSMGAVMFTENISSDQQVIVEIDPKMTRQVLTDNRDGMKNPYKTALRNFLEELAVDNKSAMADKDRRKHIKFAGGKGPVVVKAVVPDFGQSGTVSVRAGGEAAKAKYVTNEEFESQGFGGVPKDIVIKFIDAISRGEETFFPRLAESTASQAEAALFMASVFNGEGPTALRHLGKKLAGALAETLLSRIDEAEKKERSAELSRLADMHDVHIHIEDLGNDERLKTSVNRYNPNFWRRRGEPLEGRGLQANMLLAAWTACCQEAVETLMAIRPETAKDGRIEFSTGFFFGRGQEYWNEKKNRVDFIRTGAQHQKRNDAHILLVNPVSESGLMAFDLSRERRARGGNPEEDGKMGLQDLEALAIHEVSHMVHAYHNEDFANLLTEVAATFDRAKAHSRMKAAIDAVMDAYGRGRARIQPMDQPEPEAAPAVPPVATGTVDGAPPVKRGRGRPRKIRPAEALLAHAAPLTTMMVGAANAEENKDVMKDGLNELVASAITDAGEGVTEVDCDKLMSLENSVAKVMADEQFRVDLDSIDIPPIEEMAWLGSTEKDEPVAVDLSTIELPDASDLLGLDADTSDAVETRVDTKRAPSSAEEAVTEPVVVKAEAAPRPPAMAHDEVLPVHRDEERRPPPPDSADQENKRNEQLKRDRLAALQAFGGALMAIGEPVRPAEPRVKPPVSAAPVRTQSVVDAPAARHPEPERAVGADVISASNLLDDEFSMDGFDDPSP